MDKVHVYMCLHIASIKSTAENQTRLFLSSFLITTSSPLTLAEAFLNDYVAACSTAFRSATEENESGGYVTVPSPSKVTQHSSTANCLISSDVNRLVTTEQIQKKYSPFNSRSVIITVIVTANLFTVSTLVCFTA